MERLRRRVGTVQFVAGHEGQHTRVSGASSPHDRALSLAAKSALRSAGQCESTGSRLRTHDADLRRPEESTIRVLACSILPDHVHFMVGRIEHANTRSRSRAILNLGQRSKLECRRTTPGSQCSQRPNGTLPCAWASNSGRCIVSTQATCRRDSLCQRNPAKEGKNGQSWSFVVPWDCRSRRMLHLTQVRLPALRRRSG